MCTWKTATIIAGLLAIRQKSGYVRGRAEPPSYDLQRIRINHFVFITGLQLQSMVEEFFNVKGIFLIRSGSQFVVWMLCQVVFIRLERSHSSKLQDSFAAIQHGKLIHRSKIVTCLLVIGAV